MILSPYNIVGELALLHDTLERRATVVALSQGETVCLKLSRKDYTSTIKVSFFNLFNYFKG